MTPEQNSMMQDITTSAALGGGAAIARQAMSKEPFFTWNFLGLAVMASFVAIVAGLATKDMIQSETLRLGCVGVLSFCAPEVLKRLILLVKTKADELIKKSRD
jgi:hypothetical protein